MTQANRYIGEAARALQAVTVDPDHGLDARGAQKLATAVASCLAALEVLAAGQENVRRSASFGGVTRDRR